ncbi:MAG: hypothetical protein GTO22_05825 [Gemmatimonadales bacterium]|nr:hypothetical protein [Gemmatimonadales bacterium]
MRPVIIAAVSLAILASGCKPTMTPSSEPAPVPASSGLILRLDQVDTRPRLIQCLDPNPTLTYSERFAASVSMTFVLGRDGRPEPASIVVEGGSNGAERWERFRGAARRRLEQCEWTPALKDDKPVRVRMRFRATFETRS